MLCAVQVRGSNAALSAAWNVTSYPTLIAVCNGDPALAERYSGELKSERIASFLVRSLRLHLAHLVRSNDHTVFHLEARGQPSRRICGLHACWSAL